MNLLCKRACAAFGIIMLSNLVSTSALAADADAKADVTSTGTLVIDKTVELDVAPTGIDVVDQFVYLTATIEEGHQLLKLDAGELETLATFDLSFEPEDILVNRRNTRVYVVGSEDGTAKVAVLDDALKLLGQADLLQPVAYPSISLSGLDTLLVAGMQTPEVPGVAIAVDVANPETPAEMVGFIPNDYNQFGATGLWLTGREKPVVFMNTGLLPTLVAFGISAKGIVEYGDVTFGADEYQAQSLTTLGLMSDQICPEENSNPLFLISTPKNDALFLVSFDPAFRSLDIITNTPTIPDEVHDEKQETYEGTKTAIPSALLDTSCNRKTIWLGNRHSTEIEQFALNSQLQSFEKVGEIELLEAPTSLAVSVSGRNAFTISNGARTITKFKTGDGEVIGTEEGRTLQRLLTERGYPVGAIDGQIGVKTMRAAQRFEEQNGIKLNINRDLEEAIKKIESIQVQKK